MENQNIRIHLKAYDNKILDLSTEEIVNTAKPSPSKRTYTATNKNRKIYCFKISTY